MNAWFFLLIAIGLEIVATMFLKLSEGFEKWQWGMLSILLYCLCFWALAHALKVLPIGVVYAIWAGVGIIGVTALGIIIFGDRLALYQYGFVIMILIGAIGLRLSTNV